jgi:serine O-acetyltransferase
MVYCLVQLSQRVMIRGKHGPPVLNDSCGRLRLREVLKEDMRTNGGWAMPGFHAVAVYRFGRWRLGLPRVLRLPCDLLYKVLYVLVRNVYTIELYYTASVGRRFRIAHQGGIVIHHYAEIGDDCTVHHNVTLGAARDEGWRQQGPTLGNRVSIGSGAVVLGKVTIGDDARIGPNAVVTRSLPAGATAFAPPARVMLPREKA